MPTDDDIEKLQDGHDAAMVKLREFARAFRFRVFIDGHALESYSAAEVLLREGKPDLIQITAPLEVHTVMPEHELRNAGSKPIAFDGKSMKVVYPKLARWFDGQPHDVRIEQLGSKHECIGGWHCAQAKPTELAACRFNVVENTATPEVITFECENIVTPEVAP